MSKPSLPYLLTTTAPDAYPQYFEEKINGTLEKFKETFAAQDFAQDFANIPIELYPSLAEHYRMRAEFAVRHEEDSLSFGMFEPNTKPRNFLVVETFPAAHLSINHCLTLLRREIPKYPKLKRKLFEVDFLCNQAGDVVASLTYHCKLDEEFQSVLQDFAKHINHLIDCGLEDFCAIRKCSLIARARKQKLVVGDDFVIEALQTSRGLIQLKQIEGTFSQPNAHVCESMLNFALACSENQSDKDLIELYCGSGNFTIALAAKFRKVFATEVARVPSYTALFNQELNQITNLKLARLSALEVTEALEQKREFNRLKEQEIDLKDYEFSTLLIDPPRSGLHDKEALDFTAQFERVIYISCNPETLIYDLQHLTKTHEIKRLAFFDQFPYTPHLESGVLLERKC